MSHSISTYVNSQTPLNLWPKQHQIRWVWLRANVYYSQFCHWHRSLGLSEWQSPCSLYHGKFNKSQSHLIFPLGKFVRNIEQDGVYKEPGRTQWMKSCSSDLHNVGKIRKIMGLIFICQTYFISAHTEQYIELL